MPDTVTMTPSVAVPKAETKFLTVTSDSSMGSVASVLSASKNDEYGGNNANIVKKGETFARNGRGPHQERRSPLRTGGEQNQDRSSGSQSATLLKELTITPRREMRMRCSISNTPTGVNEKVYPFFCGICMEYFADIMECGTCANYCCINCLFLLADGVIEVHDEIKLNELLLMIHAAGENTSGGSSAKCMSCPHCTTTPFLPVKVKMLASGKAVNVRSYKDEVPEVDDKQEGIAFHSAGNSRRVFSEAGERDNFTESPGRLSIKPPTSSEAEAKSEKDAVSPVRVGDSFDTLKRKMKRFQAPKKQPPLPTLTLDIDSSNPQTVGHERSVGNNERQESPPKEECRKGSPVGVIRSYVEAAMHEGIVGATSPRPNRPVRGYVEAAMREALAEVAKNRQVQVQAP